MRSWFLTVFAVALLPYGVVLGATNPDLEKAQTEARATVSQTVDDVLAVLSEKESPLAERRAKIEAIVYDRFDFETITRLVLARNWRRFNPEQRAEFLTEFQRHLSVTYGQSLESYADQTVAIDQTRAERNGDVTVRTKILGAGASPVVVDYRLRKREARWRVIDVIIEGVSLISNFRTQTQEIISEVGPNGLIERLRTRNAEAEAKG